MNLRNIACVYIFHEDAVLMMRKTRSRIFSKPGIVLWTASSGGHFENYELNNPKSCVIREMFEETGLQEADIKNLTLKYITLRKKDNEIRQQYIYFADLANINAILRECDEGELHWIKIDDIFSLEMSVSNTPCLKHYFQTGIKDKFIYIAAVKVNEDNIPQVILTPLRDFDTNY